MSFLTDDDIDERLTSPINLSNRLIIHQSGTQGRTKGDTELPTEIRKVITELANEEAEPQKDLAKAFGLCSATVSNHKKGNVIFKQPNEELQPIVKKAKDRRAEAESLAISNLMSSLEPLKDLIPEIKSAKKLTSIAKDMSAIANQMADKSDGQNTGANVHLHLYGPRQKSVKDYEVIDV
jgi:hypothetical protein